MHENKERRKQKVQLARRRYDIDCRGYPCVRYRTLYVFFNEDNVKKKVQCRRNKNDPITHALSVCLFSASPLSALRLRRP